MVEPPWLRAECGPGWSRDSQGQALGLKEAAPFLPSVHAHQVALFGVWPLINSDVIQPGTYFSAVLIWTAAIFGFCLRKGAVY